MLLEAEGLVIGRLNSGYSVVHFESQTVRDLLVAREGLDAYSAQIACKTATDEDLDRLTTALAEIDALGRGRKVEPNDIDADSDRSRSWLCWAGQYE